jgi:thiamine-phosphate pyrophosphorylase
VIDNRIDDRRLVIGLPRLYAILDVDILAPRRMDPLQVCHGWLEAGVRLLQLRAKSLPGGAFLDLADRIAAAARAAGATFIVNDRADLARLSGADGVHLGQDDLAPADVRRLLGADAIIGLSTHNEAQVRRALDAPVSYIAIGPVFATTSKVKPDPVVGLEGVARASNLAARASPPRPVVAIGGITLERAPAVLAAGAASVAVISDLIGDNAAARAREFVQGLGREA